MTSIPRARVVSLPMYDFDELRPAHDQLWAAIRARLVDAGIDTPAELTHDDDVVALWNSADLAISQACGWPIVSDLVGVAVPFGTFAYDAAGVEGASYRMRIVVRADDPVDDIVARHDQIAAVNSDDSLSGWLSLLAAGQVERKWPGGRLLTGGHVWSIEAVAQGRAAIASIDAVTLALLSRHRPDHVAGIRVVGEGPLVGCLPLIVPAGTPQDEIDAIRTAFRDAVAAPETAEARDALGITGFHAVDIEHYEPVRRLGHQLGLAEPASSDD